MNMTAEMKVLSDEVKGMQEKLKKITGKWWEEYETNKEIIYHQYNHIIYTQEICRML